MDEKFISKKRAFRYCAITCAITILLTAVLTYALVVYIPNKDGERYVTQDKYELLKKYEELDYVVETIVKNYYKDVDVNELFDKILKGAAAAVGDEYTVYYTEEEYADLLSQMGGEYNGIGIAVLTNSDGDLEITTVYSSSPASEAGIEPGDKIVSINGVEAKGKTLPEVVDIINKASDNIALVILRGNDEFTFNVKKTTVEMDMIETKDVDKDGIGYIHITHFNGDVKQQFINAVNAAKTSGAKGLIVDVRDNPGGSLSAVTQILDYLLPEGLVVYTVDKNGNREEWDSDENSENIPIICLTNAHSASASEIFAGALKDDGRAKIVGKTTFGKGIVQTVFGIPSTGAGLKVTTSTYYTKSGLLIQGNGITPDIEVENTGDEDTQLNTAHQLLLEQIGK